MQLKEMRTKLGVSQMRLSKLADVSRFNISLAENGLRELTKTEEKNIKEALKNARTKNKKK